MFHEEVNSPARKKWAFAALVFLILAGLTVMCQSFIPQAHAAQGPEVSVSASFRGPDQIALKVTNTSSRRLNSATGTTKVPANVVAQGQPTTISWTVSSLEPGANSFAQHDGSDVVISLKKIESEKNQSRQNTGTNDKQNKKNARGIVSQVKKPHTSAMTNQATVKTQLARTGISIAAVVLLALSAFCLGISLTSHSGKVALRVTTASIGAVALIASVSLIAVPAHAAEVPSNLTVKTTVAYGPTDQKKTFELESSIRALFDDPTIQNSVEYAAAMGPGWNLGNTFEAVNTHQNANGQIVCTTKDDKSNPIDQETETLWGQPKVTEGLIHNIAAKGFRTIRMPFTGYCRVKVNNDASDAQIKYVISQKYLDLYKHAVDMAVAQGLHVVINVHGGGWIWAKNYAGDKKSESYRMFTDFWHQLAKTFADEPSLVSFETLNEPQFAQGTDAQKQEWLNELNTAAHDIIRSTPGDETRMILIPSMGCDWEKSAAASKYITNLKDPHVLATVHYYSQWVYSANLGRTGFDEKLWTDDRTDTPRSEADRLAKTIRTNFTDKGIGTVVGEFGLLGYDSGTNVLEAGEEDKYYEYMEYLARENGYSLIFWDNGSGINRHDHDGATWNRPGMGRVIEASLAGQRSSYSKGLDHVYLKLAQAVTIPLELNGNQFKGIEGLKKGVDYTYDAATATVTLSEPYVRSLFDSHAQTGEMADLTFAFSAGAPWHEYLVHVISATIPSDSAAVKIGSRAEGATIPITFNGNDFRRVTVYESDGKGDQTRVGPNQSWWNWLQNGSAFTVSDKGLTLSPSFFSDSSVKDGDLRVHLTMYGNEINDDDKAGDDMSPALTDGGQRLDAHIQILANGDVMLEQ